jgi:hypothetical protein
VRNIVNLRVFHAKIDARKSQKVNYDVKMDFSLADENGVSDDFEPVQCAKAGKSCENLEKNT